MKSWHDVLPIHPAADLFPLMSPDELPALGEDIIKNGLTSPIVLWADRESPTCLLDGRNRLDAIEIATGSPAIVGAQSIMAGKDLLAVDRVITLDSSVDPYAYVISANIHRRHLSNNKKRELIARLIKADPSKSDRQIAETVKDSPTTVGTVRAEMESKGDVSKLDTRRDSKGRQQPRTCKTATPAPTAIKVECSAVEDANAERKTKALPKNEIKANDFIREALEFTAWITRKVSEWEERKFSHEDCRAFQNALHQRANELTLLAQNLHHADVGPSP